MISSLTHQVRSLCIRTVLAATFIVALFCGQIAYSALSTERTTSTGSVAINNGDTSPPADGILAITSGDGETILTWFGFTDSSGISSYTLVFSTDAFPSSCSDGTLLCTGNCTTYTHTDLENSRTYYYLLCVVDASGNSAATLYDVVPGPPAVRIVHEGAPAEVTYMSIQAAYDASQLQDGDVIQVRWVDFVEDLQFDRPVVVAVEGGYDDESLPTPYTTYLYGSLTISGGTVTVQGLEIWPGP